MDDMISGRDLMEGGYVLDLNRRWAHPLGLEAVLKRTLGGWQFAGFRDLREVKGGPFYGATLPTDALPKAVRMHAERAKRAAARRAMLGALVEPVEGEPLTLTQVSGLADPERDWNAIFKVCGRYAVRLVEDLGLPAAAANEAAELAVGGVVSALLGVLSLDERGRAGFGPAPKQDGPADAERVRALLDEIEDLQEEHGQLYADAQAEVAALRVLAERGEVTPEQAKRLEEIYGLAQPAMRFFQGDPAAVDAFNARRPKLDRFVSEVLGARSELVRLLDGGITAAEVSDPAAALAELEEEIAPLAESVAAEREDLARRARELAVQDDKLTRMQRAADALRTVGSAA